MKSFLNENNWKKQLRQQQPNANIEFEAISQLELINTHNFSNCQFNTDKITAPAITYNDEESNYSVSAMQGNRKTYEDTVAVFSLDSNLQDLTYNEKSTAIQNFYAQCQAQIKDRGHSGSTSILTLLHSSSLEIEHSSPNGVVMTSSQGTVITTASIGDSCAFIFTITPNKELVSTQLLSDIPHHPRKRIYNKVGESTSLSRAIGLNDFNLSHEPIIKEIHFEPEKSLGDLSFIVLGCDGLFEEFDSPSNYFDVEKQAIKEKGLSTFVQKTLESIEAPIIDEYTLSQAFISRAYRNGSQDNITVLVKKITAEGNSALMLNDGCSGKNTALLLAKEAQPRLTACLKNDLNNTVNSIPTSRLQPNRYSFVGSCAFNPPTEEDPHSCLVM